MTGMRVGVVGAGCVGLTSAVCLAAKGLDTVCVDSDADLIAQLRCGVPVLDEQGLQELLRQGLDRGVLSFTTEYSDLQDRDVVFVCVGTPTSVDGSVDLNAVESAVTDLAQVLLPGAVVAVKSTVPVGTCRQLSERLSGRGIDTVSNPEFLREGYAIFDFQHPDRVVVGSDDKRASDIVATLYAGDTDAILRMGLESAELAKYSSNSFLAVKASYVNSLAQLCASVGADIRDVTRCMGADERIGREFLMPSPGWGGSCLPKDAAALVHTARARGITLSEVEAARETNSAQGDRIVATLRRVLQRPLDELRIGAFGLTFKAQTSDIRDSSAVAICHRLQRLGAEVTAYDPRLGSIDRTKLRVATAEDPYLAAKDADAILLLTEWPEFAVLDWSAIGCEAADGAVVIDTRNLLDAKMIQDAQLSYLGNGTRAGY
jgi:UDPglucose 6-dehydrogenase